MKDKSQAIIYSVFAVVALIVIFGLTGKVTILNKENKLLKQAVIENQALAELRLNTINTYWNIPVCKEAYLNLTRSGT